MRRLEKKERKTGKREHFKNPISQSKALSSCEDLTLGGCCCTSLQMAIAPSGEKRSYFTMFSKRAQVDML